MAATRSPSGLQKRLFAPLSSADWLPGYTGTITCIQYDKRMTNSCSGCPRYLPAQRRAPPTRRTCAETRHRLLSNAHRSRSHFHPPSIFCMLLKSLTVITECDAQYNFVAVDWLCRNLSRWFSRSPSAPVLHFCNPKVSREID